MKESKVKDENYFQVSGWMINRLGLKSTALELFAIIYGFTQDGESRFTGSLQYLCDFTGASRRTVIYNLKELTEKGFLKKYEIEKNGVKFSEYGIAPEVQKLHGDGVQKLHGDGAKSAPNNIFDNKEFDNKVNIIISFLNKKTKSNFRSSNKQTQHLLKALLTGKTPYSVDDCKRVIDNMTAAWTGTEFEQYLRPSTLFGGKFENYLNWKTSNKQAPKTNKEAAGQAYLEANKDVDAQLAELFGGE